jgi:hypothetical protein
LYLFIYGAVLGFEEEEMEGKRKRLKSKEGKKNLTKEKPHQLFYFILLQDSLLR